MKRIITTLSIISGTVLCTAGPVPQKVTQDIARSFFASTPETRASSSTTVKLLWDGMYTGPSTRSYSKTSPFYVYGIEGGEGFVVVSGDDLCRPVLGYSFSGTFDSEDIPDGMRDWFEMTRSIINEGNAKGLSAGKSVADEWKAATSSPSGLAGDPIKKLRTALWNQNDPYNRKAPVLNGRRCLTGCTNTAAAIVMHFWEHPKAGVGNLPSYSYISDYDGVTRTQPGHTLGHSYDWDNMLMDYSGTYSDAEADAVATLMYDLGIMNESLWGISATGATGASFLYRRYSDMMGYDTSIIKVDISKYKNIESWYSMLRNEIDESRLVLYTGHNPETQIGHAFVIDGYASDDYFSINWGWGGTSNGYFTLDPSAGKEDLISYSVNQDAIIRIMPNNGAAAPQTHRLTVDVSSTTLVDAVLHKESRFKVSVRLSQSISQQSPVTNTVRLALMNNGKVLRFLSDCIECSVGNEGQQFEWELETPSDLKRGDYLCLGVVDESGEWVRFKDKSAVIRFASDVSATEGVYYQFRPDGVFCVANFSDYSYVDVIGRTVVPHLNQSIDIKRRAGTDLPVRIYDIFDSYEAVIKL